MSNLSPVISVIVPVYNVEKYVARCVDSILSQSFSEFELLLIDDGSTDASASICTDYCNKDERVRYHRKENGGLSDARNYGVQRSVGEYVAFIDSDDWVEPEYLQYLVDAIKLSGSDISTCVFYVRRGDNIAPWKSLDETPVIMSNRDALLSLLWSEEISVTANCKLFRRTLFDSVLFPCGKHFEDVGTTYKLLIRSKSVAVGGRPLYNYFMRADSITHSTDSSIFDRLSFAEQAYNDLKGMDREVSEAAEYYYVHHALSVLRSCDLKNKEQAVRAKEIGADVLKHKRNVLTCAKTPKRDRIALIALGFGLPAYQKAWEVYCFLTGRNDMNES